MPTRPVFRCQFCDARPDHGTHRSLSGQVTERMFGEYLDAFPGRWLVWNGGGPLGPRRYACRKHRGDLVAYLRYHYATVAAQVWKMPPYVQRWPDEKRPHMGGSMGIIKFGLRGGLLQDAAPAGPPASGEPPAVAPSAPDAPSPPGAEDLFPPEDMFPPGELYPPTDELFPPTDELFPPNDELFPPGDLFPPGELFPPSEFSPPAGEPPGGAGEDPRAPGAEEFRPPGEPDPPGLEPPPA